MDAGEGPLGGPNVGSPSPSKDVEIWNTEGARRTIWQRQGLVLANQPRSEPMTDGGRIGDHDGKERMGSSSARRGSQKGVGVHPTCAQVRGRTERPLNVMRLD